MLNPLLVIPVVIVLVLGWLVRMGPVPEFVEETVVNIGYFCFGVFDLSFIGFVCYLSFIENPVLEKSVTLPFSNAVGFPIVPIGPIVPIS